MTLVTLNIGSTSARFAWFEARPDGWHVQRRRIEVLPTQPKFRNAALGELVDALPREGSILYRVVHGGSGHRGELATHDLLDELENLTPMAPLHQPPVLDTLRRAMQSRPGCRHIVVYDSLPPGPLPDALRHYPLPESIRPSWPLQRMGFHGFAHQSLRAQSSLPPDPQRRLITLQLGGGVSLTAWRGDQMVDTSMGATALEGPMMGTRSGDIDPGLLLALISEGVVSATNLSSILYQDSGLLGMSGGRSDRPDRLDQSGDPRAMRALEAYHHRLRRYLGGFLGVLGGCDELIIGGGAGEQQPELREALLDTFGELGLRLDPQRNLAATPPEQATNIEADDSRIRIRVGRVDEEQEMVAACAAEPGLLPDLPKEKVIHDRVHD
ncbi:acetate/propionate family kinase [Isoalcanivorax indicus]|uniref:acetate/propionate family kinase n=1 Tax=Isoalcanivorax indicus TaxID=2202653 RepID=UPI0013C4BEB2|nr:acetate/propionate family kinase [Isoalcanivorax indicus]